MTAIAVGEEVYLHHAVVEPDGDLVGRKGLVLEPGIRILEKSNDRDGDFRPWDADVLLALPVFASPIPDVAIHVAVDAFVLQLLPGIGPANANRIIQQLGPEIVHLRRVTEVEPPAAAAPLWPEFSSLISQVAIDCIGWPAELARIRRWYEPLLEQHHEDAAARLADLMQLEQIAGGYQSREQFLTELTLDPPDATSGQADTPLLDEDYLILSTMHSAKGQEWRSVFVLKAADGCIPSDLGAGSHAELEEERRLLYVAMTRAKDGLELTIPQRFYVHQQAGGGDRHVYGSRSRFIPSSILHAFEERSWAPKRIGGFRTDGVAQRIDVAARMKEMWR
jgi:DNA helicase-2/ATP-dependent DNA helicase PcrA